MGDIRRFLSLANQPVMLDRMNFRFSESSCLKNKVESE